GYGAVQGVPHRSKKPEEVAAYEGPAPEWFARGVEALLLAPTALNRQAFTVRGEGRRVSLTCDNGAFSGVDLGIGKYHFEIGAGRENFDWA
ncbi:nitroreductase family protein, partial [Oscillibacter sp.]|uniref:nitroreductase family protein n=1 Tax=Oscillibacter sp. TaxID=1945593 RepID=UPI002D80FF6C